MTNLEFFKQEVEKEVKKRHGSSFEKHYLNDIGKIVVYRIKELEEAKKFYKGYIDYLVKEKGKSKDKAKVIVTTNLGWFFGEGISKEKVKMWVDAGARHPVFGLLGV